MTKKKSGSTNEKKTAPTKPQMGWGDWLQSTAEPSTVTNPRSDVAMSDIKISEQNSGILNSEPNPKLEPELGLKPKLESATASKKAVTALPSENEPVARAQKSLPPPADVEEVAVLAPERASEPTILTVGALNKMIRGKLERDFSLIWLKGEISNFKAHPSGHFYFSLKDRDAQISAVMFRGYNSQLRFKPEDGMEVVVRGKITVYEPRGNYQIMCEMMEPVGAGALQKAFEQLKRKLEAEGLFAPERKRMIPQVPKHIAMVTSPSGAAIRDMLNVLRRRAKNARLTLVPCSVQGEKAPREIIAAIALANRLPDVDVLIVGRGGGSIEDLWAFNDEGVARAIAASRVPVISAVGHEIDFTIADFVADLRAPTPSAAAELVAKSSIELAGTLSRLQRALAIAFRMGLAQRFDRVRTAQRLLVDPRRRIEDATLRCDDLIDRLERAVFEDIDRTQMSLQLVSERLATRMQRRLEAARTRFGRAGVAMHSLSPLKVLDRGYAIASTKGAAITSVAALKVGDEIDVRLSKGRLTAKIAAVEASNEI